MDLILLIPAILAVAAGLWLLLISFKDFLKATILTILGLALLAAGAYIIITQLYHF